MRNHSRIVLKVLALLIVLTCTGFAFDGNRKGFVLGGGLGPARAGISFDAPPGFTKSTSESDFGLGFHTLIGFSPDGRNMIVYEENTSIRSLIGTTVQAHLGLSWYHYFEKPGNDFFTVLGLGLFLYPAEEIFSGANNINDPKLSILGGAGMEISKHFQLGIYGVYGRTGTDDEDLKHYQISLMVTAIAF